VFGNDKSKKIKSQNVKSKMNFSELENWKAQVKRKNKEALPPAEEPCKYTRG